MSMEDIAILSVQILQHREVAELRWDGATEIIHGEGPDAMSTIEDASQIHRLKRVSNQRLNPQIMSNQR